MSAAVLRPFREGGERRRWSRPLLLLVIFLYAALTGAAVAILPPQLQVMLGIPLVIAVGFILWLLPDIDRMPVALLTTLFVSYLAANAMWPAYIAMALPGLPWISPPRLIVAALLLLGLSTFATSPTMRAEIASIFGAMRWVNWAFWIFWTTSVVSIGLSGAVVFSINKWINNQIYWTMLFAFAGWVALRPGAIERAARVLVWSAILVSLDAIYEYRIQELPWVGHIPSFLTIEASYMSKIVGSQARAGTDIFRVRGTFSVSLQLAEYLSLVLPFLLHQLVAARGGWRRVLLVAGFLAISIAAFLTNARSGVIGFFMSLFLYGAFAIFRYWRRERHSLLGVSALALMPAAGAAFVAISLFSGKLHNAMYGGGMQADSSLARVQQWAMGRPKYLSHPFGHGAGRGGDVLGYFSPGGDGTIDAYYLSLLLEYGFIGFAAWIAIFSIQAVYGLRAFIDAEDADELYAGPVAVALLNCLVIKSVLSSEINMPMAFAMLGFLAAIVVRQTARRRAKAPAAAATPMPGRFAAAY